MLCLTNATPLKSRTLRTWNVANFQVLIHTDFQCELPGCDSPPNKKGSRFVQNANLLVTSGTRLKCWKVLFTLKS